VPATFQNRNNLVLSRVGPDTIHKPGTEQVTGAVGIVRRDRDQARHMGHATAAIVVTRRGRGSGRYP
jgi:hypothetical protein